MAAGAWLGAAIVTKLYPVLLLPSVVRRRPLVVLTSNRTVLCFWSTTGSTQAFLPAFVESQKERTSGI